MKKIELRRHCLWAMGLFALCAACGCSLKTSYPNRSLYTLGGSDVETVAATAPSTAPHQVAVRVRPILAAPPYDGTAWVYRTGPYRVAIDYYNAFVIPPAKLITSNLVSWMSRHREFVAVLDSQSSATNQWALEGRLQEISIDVSDASQPTAILILQLVLLDDSEPNPAVILNKVYTGRIKLSSRADTAAADAWTKAMHDCFRQFDSDVAALEINRKVTDAGR